MSPTTVISPKVESAVTIPRDQCYWVVLELSDDSPSAQLLLRSPSTEPLEALLSKELLPPLATLAWAAVPGDSTHIYVCLAPRSAVEAARDAGALHAGPDNAPLDWPATIAAADFNLLRGSLTPRPLERARARTRWLTAALAIGVAALVTIGTTRRAAPLRSQLDRSQTALAEVLVRSGYGSIPALTSAKQRLEATRRQIEGRDTKSAVSALQSVLTNWPQDESVMVQVDTLEVQPGEVQVQLRGRTRADVQAVADSAGTNRWKLTQPQVVDTGNAEWPLKSSFRLVDPEAEVPGRLP